MNKKRREALYKIQSELEIVITDIETLDEDGDIENCKDLLNNLNEKIDDCWNEEQECYDNLPESLQCSERGCALEEAADNLSMAVDAVNNAISYLEENDKDSAIGEIEDAIACIDDATI